MKLKLSQIKKKPTEWHNISYVILQSLPDMSNEHKNLADGQVVYVHGQTLIMNERHGNIK